MGGVDLRDGTPTLPLLIAAQRDSEVHRALSEAVADALGRVAATGALRGRSRFRLRGRARAVLDGVGSRVPRALTHAVVDRER